MKYQSMIIGCGNIAGDLDKDQIDSIRAPLTHAKAYRKHDYFDCVACIESDPLKRKKFQKSWSIDYSYSSVDEALKAEVEVDIISICSPTYCHGDHLEKALSLNPKLVFCEKPLHIDFLGARKIVQRYKKKNVHLMINYSRRFDCSVSSFKKCISEGDFGELRSIHGIYNKGLLNNGSHLLDLLIYLFGKLHLKFVGNALYDFKVEDPSRPLVLETKMGNPITLSCGNANDFAIFEIEFLFSNARVKMLNGGHHWSVENVIDDTTFNGYKCLGPAKVSQSGYLQVFQNALVNIHDCLSKKAELKSCGESALSVLQLYSDIQKKIKRVSQT